MYTKDLRIRRVLAVNISYINNTTDNNIDVTKKN